MVSKEIQITIVRENEGFLKATESEFLSILKQVCPGTNLRLGLESIAKAKRGALIVVENDFLPKYLDGGFKINGRFTPQRLMELAKMDGAIILSKDLKRITHANVTLAPDTRVPTRETGTRHKAAERTAKITGTLAITISERRNDTTLYYKNVRHNLRPTSEILHRTNETLHILEKQRELFDVYLETLNYLEVTNEINLDQAIKVIQKGAAIMKILKSQERNLIELGSDGATLKFRLKEILKDVEKETDLIIRDYTRLDLKKSRKLLDSLSYEDVIDKNNIIITLAQNENARIESIKGWRVLSKIPVPEREIGSIISEMKELKRILEIKPQELERICDKETSDIITEGIRKIKNI